MTDAKPAPIRGLFCPTCRGVRLAVTHTRKRCAGLCVRYLRCTACGTRCKSEERMTKTVDTSK